jgi:hypothetical protein
MINPPGGTQRISTTAILLELIQINFVRLFQSKPFSKQEDYTGLKIKGGRFWDDQCVRVVTTKILYFIHDYCPGLPVSLEQECKNMKLNPYRATELVKFRY